MTHPLRSLVGTPFRLHGRDPATGLDCIGVAIAALDRSVAAPTGYATHSDDTRWHAWLRDNGFGTVEPAASRDGDLWLVAPAPTRRHVMVRCDGGFVHAHAALGRVVWFGGPSPWPVRSVWRDLHPARKAG